MASRLIILVAILASLLMTGEGCYSSPDPVPECCTDYDGHTSAPTEWMASVSPAGGPRNNTGAVVCYLHRDINCLVCRLGLAVARCCVVPPTGRDDTVQPNGPAPYNEYLIREAPYTVEYTVFDWYNLYPKKEDNSGYYGYYQPTKFTGRSQMAIHKTTGETSEPSIAMEFGRFWEDIEGIFSAGSMTYLDLDGNSDEEKEYIGFLYVV